MPRQCFFLLACLLLAGCSKQPVISDEMTRVVIGPLPTDFSGSWQRNYARDDQLNAALAAAYDRLARSMPDQRMPGPGSVVQAGPSPKDWDSLVALARLAELITRPDVLTISQDDFEIRVDRKDDFSLLCAFYDGQAKAVDSPYGRETCGWDGDDRQQLRVITTLDSSTSRVPFTLRRFYTKFERPAPAMNCVETLSMKRVCSTGEIKL